MKKNYRSFNPQVGYPNGKNLFYECLKCGSIIPSRPKDCAECTCGNIRIDTSFGRMSVKDNNMIRLFSEEIE